MVAATILLNRRLALGAFFRVRVQPVGSLRVVGALLLPQLDNLAKHGAVVIVVAAAKAKVVATVAQDSWYELVEHARRCLCALAGIVAARVRAPAQVGRVGDKGNAQELVVTVGCWLVDKLVHGLLAHYTTAVALHALNSPALGFVLDLTGQVFLPASTAEAVVASKGKGSLLKIGCRVLVAADGAVKVPGKCHAA